MLSVSTSELSSDKRTGLFESPPYRNSKDLFSNAEAHFNSMRNFSHPGSFVTVALVEGIKFANMAKTAIVRSISKIRPEQ